MGHLFLESFLFHSFSFLFIPRQNFFQNFSPKRLLIPNLMHTFAIATILMWSTPHKQRARRYVQAQPTLYNRCGLIFLPVTFRIRRVYALCLCGALHIIWRCKLKYTAVRLPRVFLPFAVDHMRVVADEEVRAAFFVPLRQTAPDGFGHKATTLILCKQLHQSSAQLICAR